MRQEPALYHAYHLVRHDWGTQAEVNGKWVPARPLGGLLGRFRAAWLVFTGRCDVLWWPGQGDEGWKP